MNLVTLIVYGTGALVLFFYVVRWLYKRQEKKLIARYDPSIDLSNKRNNRYGEQLHG